MSLHDLLRFIFKWKLTLVGVVALITGLATLFVYAFPPGYGAKASLLVERTSGAGQYTYAANQDMVEILNTESVIITSRPVVEAVVDDLGLDARPTRQKTGLAALVAGLRGGMVAVGLTSDSSPREKWIERLQRQVNAQPGTQSSVLTISYNNVDPAQAQDIVNAVARHYVRRHREVFSEQGISDFYLTRMGEIESELTGLRAELTSMGGAEATGGAQLTGPADIIRIRRELSERRTDLEDLRAQFLPRHRLVRVAQSQIAALEEALAEAESDGGANTPPEVQQLLFRITNQERALTDIKARYEDAVLSERSQVNFLNVRVISSASLPAKPNISRLFLILISFVSSVVLAAMVAVIFEYFDDRVSGTEQAEGILGLRCLGSLG